MSHFTQLFEPTDECVDIRLCGDIVVAGLCVALEQVEVLGLVEGDFGVQGAFGGHEVGHAGGVGELAKFVFYNRAARQGQKPTISNTRREKTRQIRCCTIAKTIILPTLYHLLLSTIQKVKNLLKTNNIIVLQIFFTE